ncbi:MAG: hypothetical protein Kilf2KO_10590 [Rhodospirillales bacterium]
MRVYCVDLAGRLHDLRAAAALYPAVYDKADYAAGQALAKRLRAAASQGLVYDSVRRAGGTCAAVFRPRLLSKGRQERHLCYVWDGRDISEVYEKRTLTSDAG